jgi:biotin synthase-like enzyme
MEKTTASKNAACFQCNFSTFCCPDFCRFCSFGELKDSKDINRAWENIKDNIKTSAKESLGLYELKQHKL